MNLWGPGERAVAGLSLFRRPPLEYGPVLPHEAGLICVPVDGRDVACSPAPPVCMLLRLLKAKLHMAAVTQTELHYHGSVTIDRDIMDAVGLLPYEQVLVANCSNGMRGETYVIEGGRGSGAIQMNGALARMAQKGDRIIVLAFAFATPDEAAELRPRVAILDEHNHIIEQFEGEIE